MTIIPSISSSAIYQYAATITANLAGFLYGYASGWTSSSLFVLEDPQRSPLVQGAMDQVERSWVTSLFAISGVLGTIVYHILANFLGRKYPLFLVSIPYCISWILIEIGTYPWQLYISRVLSGLASGGTFALVPIFVAEISESHIRGRLGSLVMLSANTGFLVAFLAGYYLQYHTIPFIGIAVSVLYGAIFLLCPETPVRLLRDKNEEAAEKSFRFYRNIGKEAKMPDIYAKEWDDLRNRIEESIQSQIKLKVDYSDLYKTRAGRKAFIIGVALIMMHELCGCFTMLNYTAIIFRDSGTALCLVVLGAYSYCNSIGLDVKPYSWISITSFSGMMFLAAVGVIPLMFVVIAEVMPENVRSIGCTICFCLSWILAFVMVKFFEAVAAMVGMHGWVFFFAACTFIGTVFIVLVIPETKGKSYAEIAVILNK